jgi:hypothetical protein
MSFTANASGTTFSAGHFLVDDEACLRETATIAADHGQIVTLNGRKIVPAGAFVPSRGSSSKGLLYEDIDVTDGAAPGSIVTKGKVYEDRLPQAANSDAKTALAGITFVNQPTAYRPSIFGKWDALSVASAEGASSGKTALTVTGHTLATGESYVYKTHATAAPAIALGGDLTGWSTWDGEADITATTGHKITVAVKGADGKAVAGGSADVTSKA